jgi:hypothetical protein
MFVYLRCQKLPYILSHLLRLDDQILRHTLAYLKILATLLQVIDQ